MSLNYILQPNSFKQISDEQLEDVFRAESIKPGNYTKIFDPLNAYFLEHKFNSELIKEHYYTYWKYYVLSTWHNLTYVKKEDLIVLLPKQFSTAFSLDIPVNTKLFHYIYSTTGNYEKANALFREIKAAIKDERSLINPTILNNGISIADLHVKLKGNIRMETVEQAAFLAELKRQLLGGSKPLIEWSENVKTEIMYRFLSFFDLLININDAAKVIANYLHSMSGENDLERINFVLRKIDRIEKEGKNSFSLDKTGEDEGSDNYDIIIDELKKEFTFDNEDQTSDFGAVLSRLDEIAKEKNDPAIAELYYFDENSGKFKWNINN